MCICLYMYAHINIHVLYVCMTVCIQIYIVNIYTCTYIYTTCIYSEMNEPLMALHTYSEDNGLTMPLLTYLHIPRWRSSSWLCVHICIPRRWSSPRPAYIHIYLYTYSEGDCTVCAGSKKEKGNCLDGNCLEGFLIVWRVTV